MTQPKKFCFMDGKRVCDLTCKAAFEVDDPVDNVDCYFIWLAHHFGEGVFSLRGIAEQMGGGGGAPPSPPGSFGSTPKGPKGFPNN